MISNSFSCTLFLRSPYCLAINRPVLTWLSFSMVWWENKAQCMFRNPPDWLCLYMLGLWCHEGEPRLWAQPNLWAQRDAAAVSGWDEPCLAEPCWWNILDWSFQGNFTAVLWGADMWCAECFRLTSMTTECIDHRDEVLYFWRQVPEWPHLSYSVFF